MHLGALLALLVPSTAVVAIACGDDDGPNRSFDAGTDTPPAYLPEAAPPTDAGDPDSRGPFDPADEAVVCDASVCATQIVAGGHHFCARISDGTVRCWGDDAKGQRGVVPADAGADAKVDGGDAGDASSPVAIRAVSDLANVTQISAGRDTTCARLADGAIACWGGNESGELGGGAADEDPHPHAARLEGDAGAMARVDVGYGSACGTLASGSVLCWGNDENQQLARESGGALASAPDVASLGFPPAAIGIGLSTGFALAQDGAVYSWGAVAGPNGGLAGRTASITPSPIPIALSGIPSVSRIAVSGPTEATPPPGSFPGDIFPPNQHACAIAGGEVYCWGKSQQGGLAIGLPDTVVRTPTLARLGTTGYAQQVAVGGETTCARLTDGTVSCAGVNDKGQLARGGAGMFESGFVGATAIVGRVVQVAVSESSVCALFREGNIACWGSNAHGEIGDGRTDGAPHPTPTPVTLP